MASHGRYTILGKLADGGMAEIFLAVQHGAEGFEKRIVLKRILTQYSADPQFRNMLLDEAHISMSLQHSNIAQVQDLGVAGGRYFMALELVDGWDLEKIMQRAFASGMVWPAALSLYVIACVCRALAYAHAKSRDGKPLGIVHRDISPNNVLISDQGEVKLTDFGIAKAQRKREQTAAGVIKGKVAYMSPEQALGATIDKRSDIFSVGSALYRMVTDKLPFEAADDMEQLVRVQKAQYTPPEQARPTISPSVSGIITRAMRLQPAERYQTADEMLADVERVLRNEFQSAGQTELKLWLEQLGRRDDAPTIGKRRLDTSGIVKDEMGTDLSAGTSFELDDLDKGSAPTEYAMPSRPDLPAGMAPKPPPLPRPLGGSTAQIAAARPAGRRRSGFWLGVIFALAAVVGIRYALDWAKQKDVAGKLGLSQDAADKTPVAQPTAVPPPPAGELPQAKPPAAAGTAGAAASPIAQPASDPPPPAAPVGAEVVPDARPETPAPGAHDKDKDNDKPPVVAKAPDDDDDTDEEALLRDAVPDAESAVIGEDDAETTPPSKGAAAKPAAGAKAKPPAAKAPAAKAETATAILHITSAPAGAVVRTKARVLGRTPIKLHFKTGNTYEIMLIKKGYQPATRRVAVANAKARKVAVTLKKRPAPKKASKSFFKPHR